MRTNTPNVMLELYHRLPFDPNANRYTCAIRMLVGCANLVGDTLYRFARSF